MQVNTGSLADNAGLRAGDAVLQINNRPSDELQHEQAKQEIVASGNTVNLVVQRYAASSLTARPILASETCVGSWTEELKHNKHWVLQIWTELTLEKYRLDYDYHYGHGQHNKGNWVIWVYSNFTNSVAPLWQIL